MNYSLYFHACRKVFRDSTSEKTHFASKHRSEIKTQVPKKIQCKICKTIFATNHQLYIHKGRCKGGLQPPLVSVKNYHFLYNDDQSLSSLEIKSIDHKSFGPDKLLVNQTQPGVLFNKMGDDLNRQFKKLLATATFAFLAGT